MDYYANDKNNSRSIQGLLYINNILVGNEDMKYDLFSVCQDQDKKKWKVLEIKCNNKESYKFSAADRNFKDD